jgi:DtxR family Mn-dependent transcriptional regulator
MNMTKGVFVSPVITPAMENYLEGILIIQNRRKVVRVKDIAALLDVKASSVIEALNNLNKKGLVIHERYGRIELTDKGLSRARKLYERHCTLTRFFSKVIGVGEKTAEDDACRIEHYISRNTMNRMIDFMSFIESAPRGFPGWLSKYHASIGKNGNVETPFDRDQQHRSST